MVRRKVIGFYTEGRGRTRKIRPITQSVGWKVKIPHRKLTLEDVRGIHEARSKRAKSIDEALEARITNNYEKWAKAPNKWDIRGVDFFPSPTLPGDFETNVKVLAYASEQYYNKDLSNIKIYGYKSDKAFEESYGKKGISSYVYAFAKPEENAVHFSPTATRIIEEGKVTDIHSFRAMVAVSHEIGHLISHPVGNKYFDEGLNEMLAVRFTLNNLQMDRKLREKIRNNPHYCYRDEVKYVGDIALLVNNFDEEKAMNWLLKLKTASYLERHEMFAEAHNYLKSKYGISPPLRYDVSESEFDEARYQVSEVLLKNDPKANKRKREWWLHV